MESSSNIKSDHSIARTLFTKEYNKELMPESLKSNQINSTTKNEIFEVCYIKEIKFHLLI